MRVVIGAGMWGSHPEIAGTLLLLIRLIQEDCTGPGDFTVEVVEDGDIAVTFTPKVKP